MLLSGSSSYAARYERNSSRPLLKLCLGKNAPHYPSHGSRLLEEPIGIYDIQLLDVLQSQPRVGEPSNGLDKYQALYENIHQRDECVHWQTLTGRHHSHDEIKTIGRECLCSSIRRSLVDNIRAIYPCDLSAAPPGQLSKIYLTLGHRINTIKRLIIGLHGNATYLQRYDPLVDECFTKFLQRVGERTHQSDRQTASSPTSSSPSLWILALQLAITAAAVAFVMWYQERVQQQPAPQPPAPLGSEETTASGVSGSTDGAAHLD